MLLQFLRNFEPFKLDALGLVTMLGAEEMNVAVGSLVTNGLTNYLPLLAAHTVASNSISDSKPGFTLYNISDGIKATDLTGWFCRWLLSERLKYSSTKLHVEVVEEDAVTNYWSKLLSLKSYAIGLVVIGGMVTIPVLSDDTYGLINAIALLFSVIARQVITGILRASIDRQVKNLSRRDRVQNPCKVLIVTPSSDMVTLWVPREIITRVLLTNPKPPRRLWIYAARAIGWVAFGVHVVCLGMSNLVNQIITVIVILTSSVITACRFGSNQQHIGSKIKIEKDDRSHMEDSRHMAIAKLELPRADEDVLIGWGLLPDRHNLAWWEQQDRLNSVWRSRELQPINNPIEEI